MLSRRICENKSLIRDAMQLVEFTLGDKGSAEDWWDVSLVDGFNLP